MSLHTGIIVYIRANLKADECFNFQVDLPTISVFLDWDGGTPWFQSLFKRRYESYSLFLLIQRRRGEMNLKRSDVYGILTSWQDPKSGATCVSSHISASFTFFNLFPATFLFLFIVWRPILDALLHISFSIIVCINNGDENVRFFQRTWMNVFNLNLIFPFQRLALVIGQHPTLD